MRITVLMFGVLLTLGSCGEPTAPAGNPPPATPSPAPAGRNVAGKPATPAAETGREAKPPSAASTVKGAGRTQSGAKITVTLTLRDATVEDGTVAVGELSLRATGAIVEDLLRCWLAGADASGMPWRGTLTARREPDGWAGEIQISNDAGAATTAGTWTSQ